MLLILTAISIFQEQIKSIQLLRFRHHVFFILNKPGHSHLNSPTTDLLVHTELPLTAFYSDGSFVEGQVFLKYFPKVTFTVLLCQFTLIRTDRSSLASFISQKGENL